MRIILSAVLAVLFAANANAALLKGVTSEDDRRYVAEQIQSKQDFELSKKLILEFKSKWGKSKQGQMDYVTLARGLKTLINSEAYKNAQKTRIALAVARAEIKQKDTIIVSQFQKIKGLEQSLADIQNKSQEEINKVYQEWAQSVA
ncbi:MAG: hypothetical protein NTW04_02985, partial [Elusimicrobia bacterium]|nr:hypothetical protein [Elusimicrobiota bacterium]